MVLSQKGEVLSAEKKLQLINTKNYRYDEERIRSELGRMQRQIKVAPVHGVFYIA